MIKEPPQNPKVFIIVLNWNGWEDTIECLHSLQKLEYANYEIVIVDNYSTDDSVVQIREKFPALKIIKMAKNVGYAAGNNAGIRYGMNHGGDYFWILNNDTTVEKNALQPLVNKMQNDASIGMCGSMLIYYHQRELIQAMGGGHLNKWLGVTRTVGDHLTLAQAPEVSSVAPKLDFIVGASLLTSREFVEKVGMFNEDYFLFYEEIDWAMRGRQKGYDVTFSPDSIVYHKHGASVNAEAQKNQKSRLADYYQIKNRLKFSYNFFPYCLPTVYLTVIYALIKRLLAGQISRIWMIFKLMFTFNK